MKFFGEYISTPVSSPETVFLEVREDTEKLCDKKGDLFHSVMEKILFMMKMFRTYLDISVCFLMTRVSKSDVDDW